MDVDMSLLIGLLSGAAEACIVAYVANKLLSKRFNQVLTYTIFIVTQTIRRLLTDGEVWQGMVLYILSLVLLLVLCYRADFRKKASLLIVYCALTVSCELVIGITVSLIFGSRIAYEEPITLYAAYVLHKVALILLAFLFLRIHRKGLFIKEWLKYFPVPVGIFLSFLWLFDSSFENSVGVEKSIVLAILGFLTCIYMIGYVQYKEMQKRTAERLRLTEEFNWYERHYKEDKAAMVRHTDRIAHDSAHHLECLASMTKIEDVHEYAEQILKLSSYSFQITGNSDIDCILRPKQQRAEEKGINFNVNGLLPEQMDFLDRYDIVTIIGNGLANAIDACEKIAEAAKFISVTFSFSRHLTIQIDNPFVEAPVAKRTGLFRSIKKEPGHGFGMESIQEAVDRYHGHMETVIENGIFSLRIMLQQMKPPERVFASPPPEFLKRSMDEAVSKYNGYVEHVIENGVSSLRIRVPMPGDLDKK